MFFVVVVGHEADRVGGRGLAEVVKGRSSKGID